MIPNIAFIGDKIHVQREYILALKEISHSFERWLSLQELLGDRENFVYNLIMINPAHRIVQVIVLIQKFKGEPD